MAWGIKSWPSHLSGQLEKKSKWISLTLLWQISLLEHGLSGPRSLCGLPALKQTQLYGSGSWRIIDFTPGEVIVTAVHVLVKGGISTGHESVCYRDTTQKARSEGRQTPSIKSQEHLQFIIGEHPWPHPKLGSSGNADVMFPIREYDSPRYISQNPFPKQP